MRDTSIAALESVRKEWKPNVKRRVYDYIHRMNGSTCDGAEIALGLSHQTCSPAFNALMREFKIADSGRRILTRSGRKAILWVVNEDVEQQEIPL